MESKRDCGRAFELPWSDDGKIRAVVYKGRKIVKVTDTGIKDITFKLVGNTADIVCEGNLIVEGNVTGECVTRGDLYVNGGITGECVANGSIDVKEWIFGECTAKSITVGGYVNGDCCGNVFVNDVPVDEGFKLNTAEEENKC